MDAWDAFGKIGSILKHMIVIKVLREEIEDGFSMKIFNPLQFNLVSIKHDWSSDTISLFLVHQEFPKRQEGYVAEEYWLDEARKRFPYLFEVTNPILYRKF